MPTTSIAAVTEPPPTPDEDAWTLLREAGWGVVATSVAGQPYAVPMAFGVGDGTLFLATGPGRKHEAMLRNSRVCLTVVRLGENDRWESVVAIGRVLPVRDAAEGAAARQALTATRGRGGALPPQDVRRLRAAAFLRFDIREMTRRVRPAPFAPPPPDTR